FRTDLDVRIARHFYVPGEGFPVGAQPLWHWMKHYGTILPLTVAFGGLGVFLFSFGMPQLRRARRGALFLALVMLMGPGLIVNDVFKDHWGRPRPRDLVELGGTREYVPPLVMSPRENGASFCSGHTAVAAYLFTPYLLFLRRSRAKAAAVLAAGVAYGSLMGYARIAQGAHFLSDIVWSFGVVYLTAHAVFYALRLHRSPPSP
ncbi:MAG TPA: phosphatase PAP2 family protein, partial [Candidatus Krumholzibacteria bacterium]|nr:phosphatase PAP2 family protein [Candidatus Krumholzibacteria bacterium]